MWNQQSQGTQDHRAGQRPGHQTGPAGPRLPGTRTQPRLGSRHHLLRTFAGWVYAAFVIDVYSRRVVGCQVSRSLRTYLALDALKMGLWTREHAGQDTTGVIAHSDKGVQYLAVRYTQRFAEAGAVASVGSTGDSYDNALAEVFNSLF